MQTIDLDRRQRSNLDLSVERAHVEQNPVTNTRQLSVGKQGAKTTKSRHCYYPLNWTAAYEIYIF